MDRAAAEAFARPRSRLRWLDAATTLQDFALVTFDVDLERLSAVLPAGLAPEVRTLDDGRRRGFASAVSFRDVDFRFAISPVELVGSSEPMGRLDGFTDIDDAAHIVTHPLDGWFERPDGGLGRYAVWHDRLRPTLGVARRARYAVFEDFGIVDPGAEPHSVLLQRAIDFDVLPATPARR